MSAEIIDRIGQEDDTAPLYFLRYFPWKANGENLEADKLDWSPLQWFREERIAIQMRMVTRKMQENGQTLLWFENTVTFVDSRFDVTKKGRDIFELNPQFLAWAPG